MNSRTSATALRELARTAGWRLIYADEADCCVSPLDGARITLEPFSDDEDDGLRIRIDLHIPVGESLPTEPAHLHAILELLVARFAEIIRAPDAPPAGPQR